MTIIGKESEINKLSSDPSQFYCTLSTQILLRKAWTHHFLSNLGCGSKSRTTPEFKTREKLAGNHSTIFLKSSWEYKIKKNKKSVEGPQSLKFLQEGR